MTVIEYLNTELNFDLNAKESFSLYETAFPGLAKFPYYRTHFNNKKRELGLSTAIQIVPVLKEIHEQKVKREKPVFTAVNYTGQDVSQYIPETIPTGTLFDRIVSDNGFCRKCIDAVAAKSGSGKTTSRLLLAAKAVELNPNIKAALLSGEMVEFEIAREVRSSPILNNVDFIYLVNYFKEHVTYDEYWEIIEETFRLYDILIIDSFSVIYHQLLELSAGKIKPKDLIFIMTNKFTSWANKYNCNVQLILQVNKSGEYIGSTSLIHAISSLSYVFVYGQKRFLLFEKNRNQGMSVNREVFFSKNKEGSIEFDEETYKASYERIEDTKTDIKTFLESLKQRHEQGSEDNKELIESEKPKIDPKDLTLSREQVADNQMDLEDLISMEELQNEQEN